MIPRLTRGSSRGHQPDYIMMLIVMILIGIGLVLMYSISPVLSYKLLGSADKNYYFFGQLKYILVGLIACAIASSVHYENWKRYSPLLLGLSALTLLALLVPGLSYEKYGATRWLDLGPFSFQPAELLKLAFIVYLALWLEKNRESLRQLGGGVLKYALMIGVIGVILVIMQRDMGTMMVVVAASLGMVFISGIPLRNFAALLGAGLVAGWLSIITFPHRVARLATFLDPSKDPTGSGYHISQALIALGSGGIFGLGLGRSLQVYGYLPEAANDSIFAIIGEEFGYIGSLAIILLFAALVFRGLKISAAAPDGFSRYLAAGISLWLLSQALINIAAMLSLIPLTGVPLPFISYGGSSLVMSLVGVGILQNISKYTKTEAQHAYSSQRGRVGWSHLTNPGYSRRPKAVR